MISALADFTYSINQSFANDLIQHLEECDNHFNPPLHTYVNIVSYSKKIFNSADRFECWYKKNLIGLVAIYLNDLKSKKGFITNVSVLPEFSNKGIAKNLLQIALEEAKNKNFRYVELEVRKQNEKVIGLYTNLGFVILEYREKNLVMRKNLF